MPDALSQSTCGQCASTRLLASQMKTHVIIVAAGRGSRAPGDTPKQFRLLGGKPVLQWSLDVCLKSAHVTSVCLVLPASGAHSIETQRSNGKLQVVEGGATRTLSVLSGLQSLDAAPDDAVLIHDAARPGLSNALIQKLVSALDEADAAVPALPVSDALKRQSSGKLETVDRADLYRIQTPQAFRYGQIQAALSRGEDDLVDDLAAVEKLGLKVELVDGEHGLDKITYAEDFSRMENLLSPTSLPVRVGTGYDVHKFEAGDHVTLCGTDIPHEFGLAGHSDADAGWHALTDAILGALALGDIGDHFPPSDDKWKNANSGIFLEHALKLATERGWELGQCDITIICEAPKIKPNRETMRQKTADVCGVSLEVVSVKATTTEGLGFTGRREGIAAQAVATLIRTSSVS
ncbi:MAG: bifunctional 2-C-methyl-D-erythritol 4-phosphate cytidylyltransferase/2-C-methyl-D-erythritol 2,4-cyclodiphosphate synthase [Henriciella sp.]|uniref:bifunctional 2-C-methyl-D-erythritol 4-phosphate cytidylyltransferase/2-C-methyl-D-erythritol 2,4-cyclodiphosphate synthase n=1 Tax=Henriciella sp. TaxID=1968823 RepID=UPI003C739E7B